MQQTEPIQPQRQAYSPGRTVAIAIAVLAIGAVYLFLVVGNQRETTTDTFTGVDEVTFDLDNSPVDVSVGGEEVVVTITAKTGFLAGEATVEQNGNTVVLRHECPPIFGFSCDASFEVTVPADVAVSGSTSNGAITISGVDGTVSVTTSNGSVTLDDLSAITDVTTSNGSITGNRLASGVFSAATSNGSVDLSFTESPTSLDVSTSNGTVDVTLPQDAPAYALDTTTSNGKVEAEIRTDPSASDTIVIETSNGDISISYAG